MFPMKARKIFSPAATAKRCSFAIEIKFLIHIGKVRKIGGRSR